MRESIDLLRCGVEGVEYLAAVEGGLRECAEVEFGDDAEVVGAAAESDPEVGVGGCVCGDEGAVGEDDVIGEDVVADEAIAGAEEGETAWNDSVLDQSFIRWVSRLGKLIGGESRYYLQLLNRLLRLEQLVRLKLLDPVNL